MLLMALEGALTGVDTLPGDAPESGLHMLKYLLGQIKTLGTNDPGARISSPESSTLLSVRGSSSALQYQV